MENFNDYKNAILHEIITANYFLSSKDVLDYINIFTNILYDLTNMENQLMMYIK